MEVALLVSSAAYILLMPHFNVADSRLHAREAPAAGPGRRSRIQTRQVSTVARTIAYHALR